MTTLQARAWPSARAPLLLRRQWEKLAMGRSRPAMTADSGAMPSSLQAQHTSLAAGRLLAPGLLKTAPLPSRCSS